MFGMGKNKKGGLKMVFVRRRKTAAQQDALFPTSPIKMSHMFGRDEKKKNDRPERPERPERVSVNEQDASPKKPTRLASPKPKPKPTPSPEAKSPKPLPANARHAGSPTRAASPAQPADPAPKVVVAPPKQAEPAPEVDGNKKEDTPDASVKPDDTKKLDTTNKLLKRNHLWQLARIQAQEKAWKNREDLADDIISVPKPKTPEKKDEIEDQEAPTEDPEADVATVKKKVRRLRTTPSEFDVPAVEPVQPLKLDGARAAKIPHFMSEWFNPNAGENRDPNQKAGAVAAAPAKPAERAQLPLENVVSFATNKDSRTPGMAANSQNIKYSEIRLGRMIGEGAFGKVYEGKWRGRAVAVKVLVCQDLRSDILHEFQSEVEIMSVLRHPNICRLLGACLDPPNRALVIELMQRGSLWGLLRTHRKSLDLDMRTRFIYDTAKGMAYLHHFERPILHRDLKSPNLLVDKNYNIKLSDFGLARVKAHVQTMTGNCGTVQWMAPEVLGNQKYTEKADVFSFGIVIWEVMTGECPYDGMSQIQAALGVLNRNLRPTIPKQCPPFFSRLMKACWNRQPELRPSFPHIVSAFRTYQSSLSETRATSSAAASANAAVAAASVAAT